MKRYDAEEFLQALRDKGVDRLYHVTDRENWPSIKKFGLLSLDYLKERSIEPQKSCSDRAKRSRLRKNSISDLVHLTANRNPICLEEALQAERIQDPIVIEISLDVMSEEDSVISPVDALQAKRQGQPFMSTLSDIQGLDMSTGDEGTRSQEFLVKGFVPASLILNAAEIDRGENTVAEKKQAVLFILDQTGSMEGNVSIQGQFHASAAHCARALANDAISKLLESCITPKEVKDSYEFALLEYSNETKSGWAQSWDEPFVDCKTLYRQMIRRLPSEGSRTKWAAETESVGQESPAVALRQASSMVQRWLFNNKECPPPIVVLITNGKSLLNDLPGVQKEAGLLKSITSLYGSPRLLCYMVSSSREAFFEFPTSSDRGSLGELTPEAAHLFDLSSILDGDDAIPIRERTGRNDAEFRAMGVNSDLIQLLLAISQ